jgi:CBS domain containing-hemolysin-like protein
VVIADLDTDITNAFGLLAVLLVFVFAYFTTIWSRAEELIDQPVPSEGEDKRRLLVRIKTQRRLVISIGIGVLALGLLLGPLSSRVIRAWHWKPFDTVRGGLLLVDLFLVAMLVITLWLWRRLQDRIKKLQ